MTMVSFQSAQTPSPAQQTRDQIREQVRASVADAQRQVREAQRAIEAAQNQATTVRVERIQTPPTPPVAPVPPTDLAPWQTSTAPPGGFNSPADIPPRTQEVVIMFFAVMALIVVGLPIARAISRWIDRRANAPAVRTADVEPHLLRIEQAVEAMAIEIERISEAQRYLTKLATSTHADPMLVSRNQGG